MGGIGIPYVQDIESLEHQHDEQDDAFPKADREDGSGEGRMEMTSQLVPGFGTCSDRLREFHKLFFLIPDVSDVVLCGVQQVIVEGSQKVFPAAEEEDNSG